MKMFKILHAKKTLFKIRLELLYKLHPLVTNENFLHFHVEIGKV